MENIKVISASDDGYTQHLGVTFTSLLENSSFKTGIDFYVIDGGISDANKERLKLCLSKYGCSLQFLTIEPKLYEKFGASPSNSPATYFRIFLPELLELSITKVIYLDCDLVVKGDIVKLWEVDVSQYLIAAVEDAGIENCGKYGMDIKRSLGLTRTTKYFNAGVLVMNLTKWRQEHIPEKVSDFLIKNSNKTIFADQDGLNVVLANQWLVLPNEWNQQVAVFEFMSQTKERKDMASAIQNPLIIHYTKGSKPWHYRNAHPFKDEYYRYLNLTPWKGFVPADRSFRNILAKAFFKSWMGKLVYKYLHFIEINYNNDKGDGYFIPKWVYNIVFPIGYSYFRVASRLIKLSYYIEKNQIGPGIFKNRVLAKIVFYLVYPARFLAPGMNNYWAREAYGTITCPCCGYKSLYQMFATTNQICLICFWENEPGQPWEPDYQGGENGVTLRQAQQNFMKFGASEERYRNFPRFMDYFDQKDANWKPFLNE
ncbi:MAG TPA: glycosyltransferase [Bacillota bacterium]|nr:glycosyltransferase [Bacillota bacterium]